MSKPHVINADLEPTPSNPHSWMPLLGDAANAPAGDSIRVMFGCMRPLYRGFAPSVAALARSKLTVAAPPDTPDWTVTAHRAEVLLPAFADDRLACPRTLFEMTDSDHPVGGKALASYITLTWQPERLHAQWQVGLSVGRWLTETFEVAVLAVQHAPHRAAKSTCPHIHLIVPGPRRLTRWGQFGGYVTPLCRDGGRQLVVDQVAALVARGEG